MIPIWAKTMNKAWNLDIVNIKTHKNNQIFNDYVVVAGSLNKRLNPYKACIYRLCRDFLCANGCAWGTL